MKHGILTLLALWTGLAAASAPGLWEPGSDASQEAFMRHVRFLSSDRLRGRGNGTPELEEAARYIAAHFERIGLVPAGDNGSFFQEFEFAAGERLGSATRLRFLPDGKEVVLGPDADYIPLTSGGEREAGGRLLFAGFGITAPELGYDDYRNLEAAGRVVAVLEHEPQEADEKSVFSGREPTPYSTLLHKIVNARRHGAAGVIVLPNTFQHPGEPGRLPEWSRIEDLGVQAVQLSAPRGEWLIRRAGRDLGEIGGWINAHLTPLSFEFGFSAELSLEAVMVRHRVRNVAGLLPGRGDQVIVIGAHYDHLGTGHTGSLADAVGQIHNGADDNASGTAGLMELARQFREKPPETGLLFLAFAGEEMGLLGSGYYTNHPSVALGNIVAMINLDMIGRSEGSLQIGGVGTADVFRGMLDRIDAGSFLEFSYFDSPRGSSDHFSFSQKGIPVLFFFSGLHSDYHRPSDDWERINPGTMGEILRVARETVEQLARTGERIEYTEVASPRSRRDMGGGRRPLLGVFPDTGWGLGGVRLEGILADSPAERAGLEAGDILVRLEGRAILHLDELTAMLRGRSPGDRVRVEVLRRGQSRQFVVDLSSR